MAKILLIEDDQKLADMIETWLDGERHVVEVANDGAVGFEHLLTSEYDVAVIDWNLPEMEGPDIVSQYRAKKGITPIIMLTGRDTVDDKVTGFDAGADDYLTKPFHMQELSLRINAMLRRGRHVHENLLAVGDLELDPKQHTLKCAGQEITLLPKEFAVLEFLMRNPGRFYSAEALLRHVWASDSESSEDALRTCIMRMRKKIDKDGVPSHIENRPKLGYRLPKPTE